MVHNWGAAQKGCITEALRGETEEKDLQIEK